MRRPVSRTALRRPSYAVATDRPAASAAAHAAAARDDVAMATWNPLAGSADADLLPELSTLVPRSRDLARNNGLAAGGVQTLKDNIVGAVLRLSAMPDYRLLGWTRERAREWGNTVESEFRTWAETVECDAGRSLNLLGLTLQALGGALMNGEALALPLWLPRQDARWGTRLMMIEADRLDTPVGMMGRENLRGGIEIDDYGAALAYWIRKRHPGDAYGFGRLGNLFAVAADEWERIPAYTNWGRRRVLHLHDKERTGQSRGKPFVTAVMREFHMAGKYATTELQAAVANSLIAAFLESDLDPDSSARLFGEEVREQWGASVSQARQLRQLKGGAIIPLPAGARLSSFTPGRPNAAYSAFMEAALRHISAGLNIPYELFLKDFSKTNYSSARAALLEAWRYFNGRRRWLADTWLKPIFELWLEEAVNAGRIEAPDFYANRYAYTRCRFIFSGRGWVDPVKEAEAAATRMEHGLSTLEMECAEQGLDWEEVVEQRAYEQVKLEEAGIVPKPAAPAASATVPGDGQGSEESARSSERSAATQALADISRQMVGAVERLVAGQQQTASLASLAASRADMGAALETAVPPAPTFHLAAAIHLPEGLVNPAPVTVQPAVQVDVHVPEAPAPVVHVAAPVVNVEPAVVHLEATLPAPELNIHLPPRKTEGTIERDVAGNIVRTTQIETDA